jgi:predicted amidohydrolase
MTKELKIALVQTSIIWENSEQNRTELSKKINAISSDVDLIILPEMFTTGFTMTPQNLGKEEGKFTLNWMQKISKEKNAALTGSIPFHENGSYTNRLFFVEPDGSYRQYDKRHTFTLAGEDEVYKAGKERVTIDFKGFKICPLICYDLRFPVWARNTIDFDVLIYVANWPKPRITAWDTLLKARAIENMSYCVGVNRIGTDEAGHQYSGHSAVYDGLGKQLVYSEDEEIICATLSKEHIDMVRGKLKFLADRDEFTLKL